MSEGKHVRFTVQAGGVRARAVAFNLGTLPDGAAEGRLHATFTLELNEWQGAVEPRLLLRKLLPAVAEAPVLIGEAMPGTAAWHEAVVAAATSAAVGVPRAGWRWRSAVAELHGARHAHAIVVARRADDHRLGRTPQRPRARHSAGAASATAAAPVWPGRSARSSSPASPCSSSAPTGPRAPAS